MAITDWLAGIGGGAAALDRAKTDDENRQVTNRRIDVQEKNAQLNADVRAMLAQLSSDTKRDTTTQTNATRERIAGLGNQTKETIAKLGETGKTARSNQRDETTRRGQDLTSDTTRRGQDLGDTHYWDTAARSYDSLFTRDATERRGQDLTHGDRQDALSDRRDENADARRARVALGVIGLKARQKPSLFGNQNATDFAAEFDRLYNNPDAAASDALDTSDTSDTTPPASAAAAPVPRSPLPVRPRQAPAAPPKGLGPGALVTLKSGKKVTVTKVNPDGTFEYQ